MRIRDSIPLTQISAWLNSYTVFIFQNAGGLLIIWEQHLRFFFVDFIAQCCQTAYAQNQIDIYCVVGKQNKLLRTSDRHNKSYHDTVERLIKTNLAHSFPSCRMRHCIAAANTLIRKFSFYYIPNM